MSALAIHSDGPDPTSTTGSQAAASSHRVLVVELRSREGRRRHAIGGGATLEAAIAYALESAPDDTTWYAVDWDDLHGD